jgi:predicted XRE-type DNA-binding protein
MKNVSIWFQQKPIKQFQIRRFLEIDQSKTGIACGSHVCKWIKTK